MSINLIINKVAESIKDRHLFAIFDRDGTLVPIISDPDRAILHNDVLELLLKLDSLPNTRVAILSARDLAQLRHDFKNNDLILGGNYGMELLVPNQMSWIEPKAVQSRNLLLAAKRELEEQLPEETQVILEDKQLTLCLHWHLTPSEYREKVHSCIKLLKTKYSGLLFKALTTSYEIWPYMQWDKSNGLIQIASILKLDLDECLILYIGDSDSDEPAFAWVNNHQGITVRVGQSAESIAQFSVKSPKEVKEILKLLIANIQNS